MVQSPQAGLTLRVGLVAGEASGDTLGARLIEALRESVPAVQCAGIAGPKMAAAGCEAWHWAEELAVMGLVEVVPHLPRLMALRRDIERRLIHWQPDVFVGVDAKEFNLSLSRRLRAAGLLTVQYVSPQVWAWRPGRVRRMHEAVDLVLCLLPFEKQFYDRQGLQAEFVGHPLADAIPLQPDRDAARAELGLPAEATIIALLPGSRRGEITRLTPDAAAVARCLRARRPEVLLVAPMASPAARRTFEALWRQHAPDLPVQVVEGAAQRVLIAANAAFVASGTATLEAALCKRPMVVVYRLDALSAWVIRRFNLVKSAFFAQPNLLAGRRVVGEYFQEQIDPAHIADEILGWLEDDARRAELERIFLDIHLQLRQDASRRAAAAILALVAARRAAANA
ncbi:MAG: lipid-A-disaccharide synthase [Steroidobacteraceae bacterium]